MKKTYIAPTAEQINLIAQGMLALSDPKSDLILNDPEGEETSGSEALSNGKFWDE